MSLTREGTLATRRIDDDDAKTDLHLGSLARLEAELSMTEEESLH